MIEEHTKSKSGGISSAGRRVEPLHHRGDWCAQLGVAFIILGLIAASTLNAAASASVMLFGWLIVVSGLVEAVHAFHLRRSAGFFLHLVPAIAGVPIGLLIAAHPSADALAWMLLFASFFIIVGLFRIIAAFRLKFPNWGWAVFDGVVTLLFGTLLWAAWPWLGRLWIFGLAVAVSLILRGWSSIQLGLGLRRTHLRTPEQGKTDIQTASDSYQVQVMDRW